MTIRVAGSLWSVPYEQLRETAERLVTAGLQVWHWDRADGTVGPPGGFSARTARELTASTRIRAEAHLMLIDPLREIDAWAAFCELIVVHSRSPRWQEAHARIRANGVQPGLAISPDEPIPQDLAPDVAVLIMTVSPGHAGACFLAHRLALLGDIPRHPLRGVDGSVDLERGLRARSHGANWLISGTALTSTADPAQWLSRATNRLPRPGR